MNNFELDKKSVLYVGLTILLSITLYISYSLGQSGSFSVLDIPVEGQDNKTESNSLHQNSNIVSDVYPGQPKVQNLLTAQLVQTYSHESGSTNEDEGRHLDLSKLPECSHVDLVSLLANKISDSPPTFEYRVTNHHKSNIRAIYLGRDTHLRMFTMESRLPQKLEGPEGWTPHFGPLHESEFMSIAWHIDSSVGGIPPNTSLGGFRVFMNDQYSEGKTPTLYRSDGSAIETLVMTEISFRVEFMDNSCTWGKSSD